MFLEVLKLANFLPGSGTPNSLPMLQAGRLSCSQDGQNNMNDKSYAWKILDRLDAEFRSTLFQVTYIRFNRIYVEYTVVPTEYYDFNRLQIVHHTRDEKSGLFFLSRG